MLLLTGSLLQIHNQIGCGEQRLGLQRLNEPTEVVSDSKDGEPRLMLWGLGLSGVRCQHISTIKEPTSLQRCRLSGQGARMRFSGRGTTGAEDTHGTPIQSHISPSILIYEDYNARNHVANARNHPNHSVDYDCFRTPIIRGVRDQICTT